MIGSLSLVIHRRVESGVPLDKSEGVVKDKDLLAARTAPLISREVEDH